MPTPRAGALPLVPALALSLLAVLAATSSLAADPGRHWSYSGEEGPERWGQLDPAFVACSGGREQSPIDLRAAASEDLANPRLAYRPSEGRIVDNGHAVQIDLEPGSFLDREGVRFELLQLHFHAPSEHTIEGASHPVELHLVHRAESGALAVVGVLLKLGAQNAALAPLLAQLPGEVGRPAELTEPLDPATLLPADRRSYRYPGSLTTPPCSEGVGWLVMAKPIEASGPQLEALARALRGNSRPVQPRHERSLILDRSP